MEVPKHDAGQGTSLTHYVRNSSGTCGTTPAVTRTCASVKSQDRGGGGNFVIASGLIAKMSMVWFYQKDKIPHNH